MSAEIQKVAHITLLHIQYRKYKKNSIGVLCPMEHKDHNPIASFVITIEDIDVLQR
jgi:hypothetical protein